MAFTAMLLAACSSGGSGSGASGSGASGAGSSGGKGSTGAPTTLAAALALVPITSWDTTYVAFSEDKQLNTMAGRGAGVIPLGDYLGLGDPAIAELASYHTPWVIDPLAVTTAVSVSDGTQKATMLFGAFNAAAIGTQLASDGYTRQPTTAKTTVWLFSPTPDVTPLGSPDLNVIAVFDDKIIYGASMDVVNAIAAPPTTPLSSDADLRAVADCLGSAKSGTIGPESTSGQPRLPLLGVGLIANSLADASEELCVRATTSASADATEANWTKQIMSSTSKGLNEPWSQALTDPRATTVSTVPPVALLTARPTAGNDPSLLIGDYIGDRSDLMTLINP